MIDDHAMRADLEKMSSEAIVRVRDGLHEMIDTRLIALCTDILWDRHAVLGGEWPVAEVDLYSPNIDQPTKVGTYKVVSFCLRAAGPADPEHRLRRRIHWHYLHDRGPREIYGYECMCGSREQRQWQAEPSARVWPTVLVDGIRYYQICKEAQSVDNPRHAPTLYGMRCLCGCYLGIYNLDGKGDKFLPQH